MSSPALPEWTLVTKKLTWACACVPEAIMSMSLTVQYVGYSAQRGISVTRFRGFLVTRQDTCNSVERRVENCKDTCNSVGTPV